MKLWRMAGETSNAPTGTAPAGTAAAPVAPATQTEPAAAPAASLLNGAPAEASDKGAAPTQAPAQASAEKPAEKPAAADIELKLPEGFQADEALLSEFKASAKELGLDSPKAQKLFDTYAKAQAAAVDQAVKAQAAQRAEWVAQVKADKEIGGDNLRASLVAANRAVETFGGKELRDVLNATGLGDHPLLVKAFAKAGALLSEDTISGAHGVTPQANEDEAFLRRFYPNSPQLFSK